ncbi:protein-L-isoaspartate carboxylmethyltransferase [Cellulomonas sp. JH27-2]|nr:protein-L-isoaspartate carboxylmethyltransferase [Cellulomonas sp. JH27-2]
MRAVPRVDFLTAEQRQFADRDRALPLWHGQTGSQPSTVAAMLRLLAVPPGAHVLDVGAGSGWTTALLAHLVGSSGEVLGLELDAELAAWGAANVARHDVPWARIEAADPRHLGRERPGGWDRILVSASPRRLPRALVRQLAPDARMVIPVRTTMTLVVSTAGRIGTSAHGAYTFVPLRAGRRG